LFDFKEKNMKSLILIAVIGLASMDAFGYSSNTGADPMNGSPDIETKVVQKTTTAGFSDAVGAGEVLKYVDSASLGYIVTRVTQFAGVRDGNLIACVSDRAIPTSNSAVVQRSSCITKGYVDFLKYDASSPITLGAKLCGNSVGAAVPCAASQDSGIVALEAKASGTGTNLKAIINLQ
jgi:hypothetical protein